MGMTALCCQRLKFVTTSCMFTNCADLKTTQIFLSHFLKHLPWRWQECIWHLPNLVPFTAAPGLTTKFGSSSSCCSVQIPNKSLCPSAEDEILTKVHTSICETKIIGEFQGNLHCPLQCPQQMILCYYQACCSVVYQNLLYNHDKTCIFGKIPII